MRGAVLVALFLPAIAAACSSNPGSPATGGSCHDIIECDEVVCSCNDGTTESAGKTCVGERCELQDVCVRLHHCGGHGGAVGAPDESVMCMRAEECTPDYCFCVPILGLTESRTCANGFCLYDRSCETPPEC